MLSAHVRLVKVLNAKTVYSLERTQLGAACGIKSVPSPSPTPHTSTLSSPPPAPCTWRPVLVLWSVCRCLRPTALTWSRGACTAHSPCTRPQPVGKPVRILTADVHITMYVTLSTRLRTLRKDSIVMLKDSLFPPFWFSPLSLPLLHYPPIPRPLPSPSPTSPTLRVSGIPALSWMWRALQSVWWDRPPLCCLRWAHTVCTAPD